jgi:hypothetical protein
MYIEDVAGDSLRFLVYVICIRGPYVIIFVLQWDAYRDISVVLSLIINCSISVSQSFTHNVCTGLQMGLDRLTKSPFGSKD